MIKLSKIEPTFGCISCGSPARDYNTEYELEFQTPYKHGTQIHLCPMCFKKLEEIVASFVKEGGN